MNLDDVIQEFDDNERFLDFKFMDHVVILKVTQSAQSNLQFTDSFILDTEQDIVFDIPDITPSCLVNENINNLFIKYNSFFDTNLLDKESFLSSLSKKLCLFTEKIPYDIILFYLSFQDFSQIPVFFETVFSPHYCVMHQDTELKKQQLITIRYLTFVALTKVPSISIADVCRKWIFYPELFVEVCYLLSDRLLETIEDPNEQVKFIRVIREYVMQLISENYEDEEQLIAVKKARKSLLLLLVEVFKIPKLVELAINDNIIISFIVMFILYENTRKHALSLLKGNITKSQTIISQINSIVVTQLRGLNSGRYQMMGDLLQAINFERDVEKFSNLVDEIINLLNQWNPNTDPIEFIHKTIDFFIRINADYKTIRNLQTPLAKIEKPDSSILFSLISLLFGFRIDTINPRLPICHVYALNIIYSIFKNSDLIDVLEFSDTLGDFQISNLYQMRESDFDLVLINEIKAKRNGNELDLSKIPKLFSIVCKIASTVSVPRVVQAFIDLLSPSLENKFISKSHSTILQTLTTLFKGSRAAPYSYVSLSDVNSVPLENNQQYNFSKGVTFTGWLMIDSEIMSKLFRVSNDESNNFNITICKTGVAVNKLVISRNFSPTSWSFVVVSLTPDGILSLAVNNEVLLLDHSLGTSFVLNEVVIGGTNKTSIKMGNMNVFPIDLYPFPCTLLYRQGAKTAVKSYFSCANTKLEQNRKTFAEVFFEFYGAEVLLPLFAHIDFKNQDGSDPDLFLSIFEILSSALLASVEGQQKFFKANGFFIVKHLIMSSSISHINFTLYIVFYDLFCRLLDEDLKGQLFETILSSLDMYLVSSFQDQEKILDHYIHISFLEYKDYFIKFRGFKYYLYSLFSCFNAKTADLSKITVEEIDILRQKILTICYYCALENFSIDDYNFLISCLGVCVDSAKLEIASLFLKLLHSKKDIFPQTLDAWNMFHSVYHAFSSFPEPTFFPLIKIVVLMHKKLANGNLTLSDEMELLIRHFSSSNITDNKIVADVANLMVQDIPELFPMFSFLIHKLHYFEGYDLIRPAKNFVVNYNWCIYSVISAVTLADPEHTKQILKFIAKCSPSEWKKIYEMINCVSLTNKVSPRKFKKYFLLVISDIILNEDVVPNEVVTMILHIFVHLMFFQHSPFFDKMILRYFKQSPFQNSVTISEQIQHYTYDPSNSTWATFGGYFPEFDKLIDSVLSMETNYTFGLKLTEGNEWKDAELALIFLNIIRKYSVSLFIPLGVMAASFLITSNYNECMDWIKWMQISQYNESDNANFLQLFSLRLSEYKSSITNIKPTTSLFQSAQLAFEEIISIYSNFFVVFYSECHKNIKNASLVSFKRCDQAMIDNMIDHAIVFRNYVTSFTNLQTSMSSKCETSWNKLWCNLTIVGAPWYVSRENEEIKWKRSPILCGNFCPMKLKRNKHFDDHMMASFARDTGSFKSAEIMLNEYRKKLETKLTESKQANVLTIKELNDSDDEETTFAHKERQLKTIPCEVHRVTGHFPAKLTFYRTLMRLTYETGKVKEIYYTDISYVFMRLVFQKVTAFEVICVDGHSYFINVFTDPTAVVNMISRHVKHKSTTIQTTLNFANFNDSLPYTKLWCEGKMSNFDYLMHLNIISGRSFNDAAVYPLFPWVLKDYTSQEIDFKDENIYRDLTKPIGAIDPGRLGELIERLEDMKTFSQSTYLYSSFAVCPLSVYLWLLRLEPFTKLHVDLQGGRFDHAARIFSSINESYRLVTSFINDYRELIPEFYCTTEFLTNSNHFDLGQVSGQNVNDVQLPPWSHDNPSEFVYKMRRALESDYVSSHLHSWIDLIWGVNIRGKNAELHNNIYLPEMYAEIWDSITDCDDIRINQIKANQQHVGQIPPQLFFNPHPQKNVFKLNTQRSHHIETLSEIELKSSCIYEEDDHIYVFICFNSSIEKFTIDVHQKNIITFKRALTSWMNAIYMKATKDHLFIINDENMLYTNLLRKHILKDVIPSKMCICNQFSVCSVGTHVEVIHKKNTLEVPFYGEDVTCLSASQDFRVFVAGTKNCRLIMCSLFEGTKTRTMSLGDCRPLLTTITPSMGYIVTYANECANHYVFVHDINGNLVKKKKIGVEIFTWYTFSSEKSFDYILFANKRGDLYLFDPFLVDIDEYFIRCAGEISSIHYSVFNRVVIAVLKRGNIEVIPLDLPN